MELRWPAERPDQGVGPVEQVIDRMEEVRAASRNRSRAANAMYARWAGRLDDREALLRLALDMPTGLAPIGGLPKDSDELVVRRCSP